MIQHKNINKEEFVEKIDPTKQRIKWVFHLRPKTVHHRVNRRDT